MVTGRVFREEDVRDGVIGPEDGVAERYGVFRVDAAYLWRCVGTKKGKVGIRRRTYGRRHRCLRARISRARRALSVGRDPDLESRSCILHGADTMRTRRTTMSRAGHEASREGYVAVAEREGK